MAARNKTFGSILGHPCGRRKGTHKFRGATRSRDCARNYGHLAGTERRRRRLVAAIAISGRMNYLVGESREFFGAADARQVTTHCLEHSRGMKWFHETASGCLLCPGFSSISVTWSHGEVRGILFHDRAPVFLSFFLSQFFFSIFFLLCYNDTCIDFSNCF